jgi:hypothetical protein
VGSCCDCTALGSSSTKLSVWYVLVFGLASGSRRGFDTRLARHFEFSIESESLNELLLDSPERSQDRLGVNVKSVDITRQVVLDISDIEQLGPCGL